VVGVGGVADDALVLLVEGLHRPPGEGDPALQLAGVGRERNVLPRGAPGGLPARMDGEP
jgi:hypothetical protein